MEQKTTLLRPGAYTRGWHIFNTLSKPHVQIVLAYVEQHPGCSSAEIYLSAGLKTNRTRVSQVLKELKALGLITISQGYHQNYITIVEERVHFINNTIARLL